MVNTKKINYIIFMLLILINYNLVARQTATLRDIFRMYSSMTYGTTIKDLCIRFNPHSLHINERKLVQFGILEGLIRRVYKVN